MKNLIKQIEHGQMALEPTKNRIQKKLKIFTKTLVHF